LELDADQEDLVASNLYSVAEAQFDPDARPRVIYAGKCIVGFLMYDVQKMKNKTKEASIYRFMIDRKYQRKGYGRAALSRVIEEIRAIPGVNRISILYIPENPVAKQFYTSFGFVEAGRDQDGEMIAVLKL
ncbi:MAG: GNAT family N-acetyltransferase, partial [Nitrososphaeraceae archaeon]